MRGTEEEEEEEEEAAAVAVAEETSGGGGVAVEVNELLLLRPLPRAASRVCHSLSRHGSTENTSRVTRHLTCATCHRSHPTAPAQCHHLHQL
jgi:hypothetical protein